MQLCPLLTPKIFTPPRNTYTHTQKSNTPTHVTPLYVHGQTNAHVVVSTMGHTESLTKLHCVHIIIIHIPGGWDIHKASILFFCFSV